LSKYNVKKEEVDVYLDLHSHTNILGACIYGIRSDDVFHMERHALFPKLLSQIADDFYIDNTIYCKEPLRSGSSRRWITTIFFIVLFISSFTVTRLRFFIVKLTVILWKLAIMVIMIRRRSDTLSFLTLRKNVSFHPIL